MERKRSLKIAKLCNERAQVSSLSTDTGDNINDCSDFEAPVSN